MSIVSALVLALAITFHASVTFDEFNLNDARYQQFGDDGETLLGWRSVGDIKLNDGYASWWYGTGNEGGSQKGKTVTMTQQFNYNMVLSICTLALGIGIGLDSFLLLILRFGRESSCATHALGIPAVRSARVLRGRALIGRPLKCPYFVFYQAFSPSACSPR